MQDILTNLTVLRNILNDKIFSLFAACDDGTEENFAAFIHAFYEKYGSDGADPDFAAYTENLILYDENILSKSFASGVAPSRYIKNAYLRDLSIISDSLKTFDLYEYFKCNVKNFLFCKSPEEALNKWSNLYTNVGYGRFLKYNAFVYENGDLTPSGNGDDISIYNLKDYASEKQLISDNIESFIDGLPYSDMLLYGDMGTGKSSTVRAMLKKYSDRKLRLIEVGRKNLSQIPEIRRLAALFPMKFLIFIDDLTIDDCDERLSSLKTSIEGSSAVYKNSMIVATSNRRHIVKEKFIDRENDVHANDLLQEQLSLSDRFGLTVMFSSVDKSEYLSIVRQLASDKKITLGDEELCFLAERWAISKGGRSPRRAKQFIDLAAAAQIKGVNIDF